MEASRNLKKKINKNKLFEFFKLFDFFLNFSNILELAQGEPGKLFFGGLQKLKEYILNVKTYYILNYSNYSCFSTFSNILELAQGEPGILLKKIKNGGLQKVKTF